MSKRQSESVTQLFWRREEKIIRNRWGPNVTCFWFRSLRFSRRRRIRWRTASGSPSLYTGCRCFCLKTSVSEGSKPFWPHITLSGLRLTLFIQFDCFVLACQVKTRLFTTQENKKTGVKGHEILLIENKLILKVLCITIYSPTKRLKSLSYAIVKCENID